MWNRCSSYTARNSTDRNSHEEEEEEEEEEEQEQEQEQEQERCEVSHEPLLLDAMRLKICE